MFFSFKNFFKFILVTLVFIAFFLLITHFYDLENNDFLKNTETIPIIESDKEPFKIKPENENN